MQSMGVLDATPVPPTPAELTGEGWERRFMVMGERIEETVALYRRLGYAVRIERPTAAELRAECDGCRLALEMFRVVYTRKAR